MNTQRAADALRIGQSLWYDNISRSLLTSGELARLVEAGVVRGITTNPTIFQKAVASSDAYDDALRSLAEQGKTIEEIYHTLTVNDVRAAADLLRPVFDESTGLDGYVSLGGLGGPAILPLSLAKVAQMTQAFPEKEFSGIGGISDFSHALSTEDWVIVASKQSIALFAEQ